MTWGSFAREPSLRWVSALEAILLGALFTISLLLPSQSCPAWQKDYKRFIYSETLKNSPVLYGLEDVEVLIGERPSGCSVPTSLSLEDIRKFRDEGIGPNHFLNEFRAASRTD